MSDLLDTCERVLRLVGTDAEAEVTVASGTEALTRFATGFIHQNVADAVQQVHLRLALDGRVAEATGNQTDDGALSALVRSTMDAARVQPVDAGWPGLAPSADAAAVDHWDDATAAAEPAERADRVGAFVASADGLETAGFCSTEGIEIAFANSAGQRASGRTSGATLDGARRPCAWRTSTARVSETKRWAARATPRRRVTSSPAGTRWCSRRRAW
jgi:predicted Zn-dependent protease